MDDGDVATRLLRRGPWTGPESDRRSSRSAARGTGFYGEVPGRDLRGRHAPRGAHHRCAGFYGEVPGRDLRGLYGYRSLQPHADLLLRRGPWTGPERGRSVPPSSSSSSFYGEVPGRDLRETQTRLTNGRVNRLLRRGPWTGPERPTRCRRSPGTRHSFYGEVPGRDLRAEAAAAQQKKVDAALLRRGPWTGPERLAVAGALLDPSRASTERSLDGT